MLASYELFKTGTLVTFPEYFAEFPELGLSVDLSRINFPDDFFATMGPRLQNAFTAMASLEKGAIANPDENRMVGHYWLRNPALAPSPEIRREIEETIQSIKSFAAQIHEGKLQGAAGPFRNLLLIGIGGSALGPQFVANALGRPTAVKLAIYFFDNTDPDGMDNTLSQLSGKLGRTLSIIVSKSGGTKETSNGMLEAEPAFRNANLDFGRHAVAVTSKGSDLDKYADQGHWLKSFPMWDWLRGRTSELSAVGLLPAALQGFDVDSILAGAKACDDITRVPNIDANPAAQMALAWFYVGNGKG
jgi:glucose-6-phosphate isomerase